MDELDQTAGAPPADAGVPEADPAPEAPSEAVVEEAATEGLQLPADTPAALDAPVAEDTPQAVDAPVPTGVVACIDDLTVSAQASGNSAEHNLLSWLQVHLMGAKSVVTRAEADLAAMSPEAQAIFAHFKLVL